MGNFRSVPVTTKDTVCGSGNGLQSAATGMEGFRKGMEDAHCAVHALPKCGLAFFGVFDGHSGAEAAQHCAAALPAFLDNAITEAGLDGSDTAALSEVIRRACLAFDKSLPLEDMSGCTAIMAVVTAKHIIVANIGDSRAVLAVNGGVEAMSYDHKPDNPTESARVQAAGGSVWSGRVDGQLAVSRAFGDFRFKYNADLPPEKQPVSPEPDIKVVERSEGVEFLILACDGVWDVMTNEDCVNYIRDCVESGMGSWGEVCEAVVDNCLDLGSKDNMTCAVVVFPEAGPKLSGNPGVQGNPSAAGEGTAEGGGGSSGGGGDASSNPPSSNGGGGGDDDGNPTDGSDEAKSGAGAGSDTTAGAGGAGAGAGAGSSGGGGDDANGAGAGAGPSAASAKVVSVDDVKPWSEYLTDLQLMERYTPRMKVARTQSSKRLVFAANQDAAGDGDLVAEVVVDGGGNGKEREVDVELNDKVALWAGAGCGDLLRLRVDAIVAPAQADLSGHGSGLYGRVHRLAGPTVGEELSSKFDTLAAGEVAVTPGHNLPARHIIHAVVAHTGSPAASISSALTNALDTARDRGFRSVAIPPLAAVEVGMTIGRSADIIANTIRDFFEQDGNRDAFDRVVLCSIAAGVSEAFENALRRAFPGPPLPSKPTSDTTNDGDGNGGGKDGGDGDEKDNGEDEADAEPAETDDVDESNGGGDADNAGVAGNNDTGVGEDDDDDDDNDGNPLA